MVRTEEALERLNSREAAKGRLHSVLAHDRTGLDGARLLELRKEIAEVLARYVSIDNELLEIGVERGRDATQLKMSGPLRAHGSQQQQPQAPPPPRS